MKYKRLTIRINGKNVYRGSFECTNIVDRLAELEDKIENGTLVNRQVAAWYEETNNTGDMVYHCSVCENDFVFLEGTPEENDYHFCPNCGSIIAYVYPTNDKE